ncbi:hypothetical protein HOLleu_31981 [Holothuria leucospilota]|uniref:Uncharacterized protein n=1 Tax=Holothuria leucospilota TaxID=206669 RepID=A0A9Q0YSR1_HOLLE|nr:hypothetical protein HOLleu_31981 [Holothuria leucospilota]
MSLKSKFTKALRKPCDASILQQASLDKNICISAVGAYEIESTLRTHGNTQALMVAVANSPPAKLLES